MASLNDIFAGLELTPEQVKRRRRLALLALTSGAAGEAPPDPTQFFSWIASSLGLGRSGATITTTFNIDSLKPVDGAVVIYVQGTKPNNSGDGLSLANAKRDFSAAIAVAGVSKIIVDETAGPYYGTKGWRGTNYSGSSLYVTTLGGGVARFIDTDGLTAHTWTLHSGNAYKCTLATANDAVCGIDFGSPDAFGFPTRPIRRNSIQDVIDNPGSDFWAGSVYYAHASDSRGLIGSTDFFASDNTNNGNWIPTMTSKVFIENIEFSLGSRAFRALCQTAGVRPVLCFRNCDFYNSANSNNVAIQGPFDVYLQDCKISGGWQDGDNIHGDTVGGSPRVLELRCDIGRNGYSASGANNASTGHEDARIVSINSTYRTSESRVIHDITTCKRWMLGCTIGASLSAVPDEASAVQVDDSATIWLDSCTITHNAAAAGDLRVDVAGSTIYHASNIDVSALTTGGAVREYSPAF